MSIPLHLLRPAASHYRRELAEAYLTRTVDDTEAQRFMAWLLRTQVATRLSTNHVVRPDRSVSTRVPMRLRRARRSAAQRA